MADVISTIGEGFKQSFLMAYEVWWALVLGFAISAIVQAWVPRERVESALSGSGFGPLAKATGLGAASSSCSYAAIAIAKSLFQKGASAATALAFQFASTNLVWELGLVIWILIGWQFTLAEFVGGIVLIALMAILLRRLRLAEARGAGPRARPARAGRPTSTRAARDEAGLEGATHFGRRPGPTSPTTSAATGRCSGRRSRIGFLLAGFIGLLGDDFFNVLFIEDAPPLVKTIENVIVGPIIAVLSFVCSVGNAPLAAVLWSGGIGFAGVIAFIFADLIVLPIVAAYIKYYGRAFALRITALMFVIDRDRGADRRRRSSALLGLIPDTRPLASDIFGSVELDYKLVLNLLGAGGLRGALLADRRRGAPIPSAG